MSKSNTDMNTTIIKSKKENAKKKRKVTPDFLAVAVMKSED